MQVSLQKLGLGKKNWKFYILFYTGYMLILIFVFYYFNLLHPDFIQNSTQIHCYCLYYLNHTLRTEFKLILSHFKINRKKILYIQYHFSKFNFEKGDRGQKKERRQEEKKRKEGRKMKNEANCSASQYFSYTCQFFCCYFMCSSLC